MASAVNMHTIYDKSPRMRVRARRPVADTRGRPQDDNARVEPNYANGPMSMRTKSARDASAGSVPHTQMLTHQTTLD
jgi:hypothetical protein